MIPIFSISAQKRVEQFKRNAVRRPRQAHNLRDYGPWKWSLLRSLAAIERGIYALAKGRNVPNVEVEEQILGGSFWPFSEAQDLFFSVCY